MIRQVVVVISIATLFASPAYATEPENVMWHYLKKSKGNQDVPGFMETEFIKENVIQRCMVGSKYPGYFGWVEFKMTFNFGQHIENPEPTKIYGAVIDYGNRFINVWRGEDYIDSLKKTLSSKGCKPI